MNKHSVGVGVFLAGFLAMAGPQDQAAPQGKPAVVVGTFDSRAVLVAYVGSRAFNEYVTAQKADVSRALDRARAMGDKALAAELDALGPAMQKRIHEQGFSTAPVDDILARIADKLPGIAQKAGVDVIVSKWTLCYTSPTAKFVDVTEQLAAAFEPGAKTLQAIRQIMATEPVPIDRIEGHK
jgi:hypothetical protein